MAVRVTPAQADALFYAVPLGLTALGLLSPDPAVFFSSLFDLAATLCLGQIALAALWEGLAFWLAQPPGCRIQSTKADPPKYVKEIVGSTMCMYVVACIAAWPLSIHRRGLETAFRPTVSEAAWGLPYPHAVYTLKIVVTMLLADAHTFWKHYWLHRPSVYAFHKFHHQFHNPSTFAGFAIHPVEAVITFCPIVLMCFPECGLYFPMHLPFLLLFGLLNLYLHCGYAVPALEATLPKLLINTSVWHNKHHELSVTHFGEMLTLWDYVMGTHTGTWGKAKYSAQAARVADGITGLDGWKAA
eukprot:m.78599 g.78599  ORF g.78599 m.78599 type:complete len:300 (-) comp10723_c0_seq1:722-1621(-)